MTVSDFFGGKGRGGSKSRIRVMGGYDEDQDPDESSNALGDSQVRL